MAQQPTDEGKQSWELEAKELRQLLTELSKAIPQVKATDLADLKTALTATQAEIKIMKEQAPDQTQSAALIKNLEKTIQDLTDKVTSLETNLPPQKKPDVAVVDPLDQGPKKKARVWV